MTYRTPDVYVEEISVFPPSVAEVETAIPAFVGYTAKATRTIENDLHKVPTKVVSLLAYESLFGTGPALTVDKVVFDDKYNFTSANISKTKHLYDSMRLFFDNGGGKCYIVSVGLDTADTDKQDIIDGLQEISKQDEPTILLFPDAAELGADDLASVQQHALSQCGKLGDRVAMLDTRYYNDKNNHDIEIGSFRGKLGINSLKYGAAYAPWLRLNYAKNVAYSDIKDKLYQGNAIATTKLSLLTGDPDIKGKIGLLDNALADKSSISASVSTLSKLNNSTASSVPQHLDELLRSYAVAKDVTSMKALFGYVMEIVRAIDGMAKGNKALTHSFIPALPAPQVEQGVLSSIKSMIAGTLKPAISTMISLEKELTEAEATYPTQWNKATVPSAIEWGDIFKYPLDADIDKAPVASTGIITAALTQDKLEQALPGLNAAFSAANSVLSSIAAEAENWSKIHEQFLFENFPVYRNFIKGVGRTLTNCPPSGAIAGIYAMMDSTRGVWKAPANVSLSSVIEPTYYFDTDDTDNLNVDAVSGKSINAIRAFSGKGTLVWGARTLAGNDNEWRYISVRRFFNMVEESVKKSTYWAVFEPNDANTWIKVRGMIENYLTQKWREGALAGATTKEAFFVRCGLGVTMNAQDILNGFMNVEIGMAVVRPAEFIVLKFSHKLQTS